MSKLIIGILAVMFLLFGGVYLSNRQNSTIYSGVTDGQAYNSTTTSNTWDAKALVTGGFKLLKTGSGTLGSVVITNSTAGSFNLYDATTTVNGGAYGTTTLARIAASVAAGTYMFDSVFNTGLIVEFQSSNVASSTITWR
jgi:hypothetical protein